LHPNGRAIFSLSDPSRLVRQMREVAKIGSDRGAEAATSVAPSCR
jgi:hypothetical protein